jgi:hypothetical protein
MADYRSDQSTATQESEDTILMTWTCHPAKRRPLVTAAVVLLAFSAVVIVFYATESRFFAILTLLIMWGSLAKFFFPTTYILSEKRITIKTLLQTLHKDWSQYRSCYPDKNGVLLSPFLQPSRLENFRGLYLLFEGNREQVTVCVRDRMNRQSQQPSETT